MTQEQKQLARVMYCLSFRYAYPRKYKAKDRAYRAKNKFNIAMHKQILRLAFSEESKASDKWRRSPDHPNAFKRRQTLREANKRYIQRYPEKSLVRVRKRQATIKGSTVGDPTKILQIYSRAAELKKWFDVVVDHIIPLAKGGAHSAENLQIIYAHENAKKGARLDYKPKVIFI